jgi:hypothetical protein
MAWIPRMERLRARWCCLPAAMLIVGVTTLLASVPAFAQVVRQGGDPDSPVVVPPPAGYDQSATEAREVPLPGPNGGVMLDVRGLMTSYMYAHRSPDGTTTIGCVSTREALDAAVGREADAGEVGR